MAIETNAVQVGTMAPDFNLETTTGHVNLSEYRGRQNVVLYFMRELSCMMCQRHVAQLKQLYSQLQQRGTTVLVVGGGSQQEAQRLSSRLQLPFPVAADTDGEVYHRYGLEKVMLFLQRSGTILIDKQGKVSYIHRVTNPGASVDKDELLKEIDLVR
jgi:peroxiredoxin